MALEEKRQELGRGAAQPKGKGERERVSSPAKEEKKDTSIFGGKTGMEKEAFDYKLSDPEIYRGIELGEQRRSELGKKLFEGEEYIKKSDLELVNKELNLGKWGKFKDFSQKDKEDAKRLIRELEK